MSRSYYSSQIRQFLDDDENRILWELAKAHAFALEDMQRNAWIAQIRFLKDWLSRFESGTLAFEYSIPRMGKRADCIFLFGGMIFVLEFKVGSSRFDGYAIDQVMDYALDLKNFHEESHWRPIVPVLIATEAPAEESRFSFSEDWVADVVLTNGRNLSGIVAWFMERCQSSSLDHQAWLSARYKPTPTIVEAAQALYDGHSVEEITRSDAGVKNLSVTAGKIAQVIEDSRKFRKKSICFVTGVPGAGKTLVWLDLASRMRDAVAGEHAVFLSWNGPLVEVLQEALARNGSGRIGSDGKKIGKGDSKREAKSFIQNVHHFRDEHLADGRAPVDRIVVFDEAQRAWTKEMTSDFMRRKKWKDGFDLSEPEFLIGVMDRHPDWATVVCLVGGWQEINTGEAGLSEWLESVERSFPEWNVYVSDELVSSEYGQDVREICRRMGSQVVADQNLHLSVSVRSFRSEKVSALVWKLLEGDALAAAELYREVWKTFPIRLTRDLSTAKAWLKKRARGNERFGLLASAWALRLKSFGISVKSAIDPANWFLNDKGDVRSSYFLEDVATEFDVQWLELDWTCVAWDANFRFDEGQWHPLAFKGTEWQETRKEENVRYQKNAYRVLLTRARQGMVIFVPHGNPEDRTRLPEFYNGVYELLSSVGFERL